MVTEATSSGTVAAWVAWFSAVLLALLGVNYYALLGAFAGVLFTISTVRPGPLWRMVPAVAITTFVAAALGQGLAESADMGPRSALIAVCVVIGAGGQVIVQAAIAAVVARLEKLGGGSK